MDATDLCYMSATELLDAYREKTLSPVEVTEAILDRIERVNPALNAFVTITSERARADAQTAERAWMQGEATGALTGVPISIKDITYTKGIRTTRGSLLYANEVPDEDAPFVERVYAAGAVMLGKTNTPELGWKGDSGNRVFGPTHNPWKHGRTAGGSSGGAAAAVGAGLGPLASGTDGAGSIRIPAGFCGVYGLKPSFARVAYYPPSSVEKLAHIGPITRTVRDSALLMNVTAGADPRDAGTWPLTEDYLAACEGDIRGLRIAWSPDLGFANVDPDVAAITRQAAEKLVDLGCHVEEVEIGLPDPWPIVDTLWAVAQAGAHGDMYEQVKDQIDPGRIPIIERGRAMSAAEHYAAITARASWADAMRRFMANYDLLVTPQLPITAFPAGDHQPGEINGVPTTYLGWTAFTYPFNVTGQPAATIPCGFAADGLPVALQFVGRWHDDATVLRASAAWEEAFPWRQHRPPLD